MYVDLRSTLGRAIFMKGEFDPKVFEPLVDHLKPGGVFLDVGANIGYYSMRALDFVGSGGTIHAFEIDDRPLRCLEKTIRTHGLKNVLVHRVAIGAEAGAGVLQLKAESGHNTVRSAGTGVQVSVIDLDSWRRQNGVRNIQVMKIDIEGGELAAFRGARQLISEERPVIVSEAGGDSFSDGATYRKEELVELLTSLHYQVTWLNDAHSPTIFARPL